MICAVFGKNGKGLLLAEPRTDKGPTTYFSINGQYLIEQINNKQIRVERTQEVHSLELLGHIGYYGEDGWDGWEGWSGRTQQISSDVEEALQKFNLGERLDRVTCQCCQHSKWVKTEATPL